MLAVVTYARAARALCDEPLRVEVTTEHVLILIDSTLETQVLAETAGHHGYTHSSKNHLCGVVHMVQFRGFGTDNLRVK